MYKTIIALLFIVSGFNAFAGNNDPEANRVIKGTVTDDKGQPLTGVEVFIEALNKTVYTDFDGNFEVTGLKADNYTVVFTYIAYKEKKTVLQSLQAQQDNLTVKLEKKKLF